MKIDISNFIDKEKLFDLLNKNNGKKIICFGAGTATYYMQQLLPDSVKIEYYLDSNSRLWGINPQGHVIKNPEDIIQEEKGKYIVLIVSQHALSMRKQLESYGLIAGTDFIDLYTEFEKLFRMQKIIFQADKIMEIINKTPTDAFDSVYNQTKKIGVVAACSYMGAPMIYDIGIFLLLNYNGYSAELIMDNTYTCENFTMYEGASEDIKIVTDEIIKCIKLRFPKLVIKYIKELNNGELTVSDLKKVRQLSRISTIWQKSRQNERSMNFDESVLEEKFYNVFKSNLINIKSFFEENNYDIITVSTALHYHRGLYMWIGETKKMRVANYDGANNDGKTSWATNYPNGHHYDIPKLILEDSFTEPEKAQIIEKARNHFMKRRYAVSDGERYNYQLVKDGEGELLQKWYDVLIPLNVMWDAAAIGINQVFETEQEWLIETINFILKCTTSNIMVREHPVQMQLKKYNNSDYGEILKNEFGQNERLKVVKYNDKINTYEFMDHCKLILPLSSTIGVEAAFMGKQVIVHSKCYYSKLNFVKAAKTREEYFKLIKMVLDDKFKFNQKEVDEAYMSYYLLMNSRIETLFSEANLEWLFHSLEELSCDESVKAILNAIVNDIPIPYYNTILDLQNA